MKKLLMPAALICAVAAMSFSAPRYKTTVFHTIRGHTVSDEPAVTLDGGRVYFIRDSTELIMLDRKSGKETRIAAVRGSSDVEASAAGDRLAFTQRGEGGDDKFMNTLALDPRTGLATGEPQRVSLTKAGAGAISPDGRLLAFRAAVNGLKEDNLVVMPVTGGPERILARTNGAVWPIHWSPDSRSIYYGYSPVKETATDKNGIYAVPAAGGELRLVVRTADWGQIPGLSPDGKLLMFWDPSWDSVFVQTIDGKRLAAWKPGEGEKIPDHWENGYKAFGSSSAHPTVISVYSAANGTTRVVTDSADQYSDPRWSPDGRRIALVKWQPRSLVLMNADGSSPKVLTIKGGVRANNGLFWSPNGESLLYQSLGDSGITGVVDVKSGAEHEIAKGYNYIDAQWTRDSRSVLYTTGGQTMAPDSTRTVTIHQKTVGGTDRVLRTVTVACARNACGARFVDDTLLAMWAGGKYRIHNLRTGSTNVVYDRGSVAAQGFPTFSENGQWMAIRLPSGSDPTPRQIEVLRTDGASKTTVAVPFGTTIGLNNPRVSNDGTELIVGGGAGGGGPVAYYRVTVATGKATLIGTITNQDRWQFALAGLSPDGKSIAYGTALQPIVSFFEVDLSPLSRAVAPGGRR